MLCHPSPTLLLNICFLFLCFCSCLLNTYMMCMYTFKDVELLIKHCAKFYNFQYILSEWLPERLYQHRVPRNGDANWTSSVKCWLACHNSYVGMSPVLYIGIVGLFVVNSWNRSMLLAIVSVFLSDCSNVYDASYKVKGFVPIFIWPTVFCHFFKFKCSWFILC